MWNRSTNPATNSASNEISNDRQVENYEEIQHIDNKKLRNKSGSIQAHHLLRYNRSSNPKLLERVRDQQERERRMSTSNL